MSKSEGNFIMLDEAVAGHRIAQIDGKDITIGWSTDSTRLALGIAGDALDDANFSCEVADKMILRLILELDFAVAVTSETMPMRTDGEKNFFDRAFEAQIDACIENARVAYESMRYAEACKYGFYEMINFRDAYQNACKVSGVPIMKSLAMHFLEVFAVIVSPITPHFSEKVWREYLKHDSFVARDARWPKPSVETLDISLVRSVAFINETIRSVRLKVLKAKKHETEISGTVTLQICNEYPVWKQKVLMFLQSQYDKQTNTLPDNIMTIVKTFAQSDAELKPLMQKIMKVSAFTNSRLAEEGATAFELCVPYDQVGVIVDNMEYVRSSMFVTEVKIELVDCSQDLAVPGKPNIIIHA